MKHETSVAVAAATATLQVMPHLLQIAERAAREAGTLSTNQAGILFLLTDSRLRGVDLAQRLGVSRAAVTEAVQRLESAKLIERNRDPDDRRAWLFSMTPEGQRSLEEFGKVTSEAVADSIGRLPVRHQRALLAANSCLLECISEMGS